MNSQILPREGFSLTFWHTSYKSVIMKLSSSQSPLFFQIWNLGEPLNLSHSFISRSQPLAKSCGPFHWHASPAHRASPVPALGPALGPARRRHSRPRQAVSQSTPVCPQPTGSVPFKHCVHEDCWLPTISVWLAFYSFQDAFTYIKTANI